MPKKKKSRRRDDSPPRYPSPERRIILPKKFWRNYRKISEDKRNKIRETLKLIQEGGFTPGMNLRPLPQNKSIKYLKASDDLYITVNIEYEEGVQIITARCIRNHDTLGLNP